MRCTPHPTPRPSTWCVLSTANERLQHTPTNNQTNVDRQRKTAAHTNKQPNKRRSQTVERCLHWRREKKNRKVQKYPQGCLWKGINSGVYPGTKRAYIGHTPVDTRVHPDCTWYTPLKTSLKYKKRRCGGKHAHTTQQYSYKIPDTDAGVLVHNTRYRL